MNRPQRLLLLALLLSLLVHLLVALLVRQSRSSVPAEPEAVTIEHRSAIVRLSTPSPQPHRTPAPHPRAIARPAPHSVRGVAPPAGAGGGSKPVATQIPQPTAAPTATAAAVAACGKSDAPAAVVSQPPPPHVPNAARTQGTSGIATIRVALDSRGAVAGAQVSQSSGNSSLDVIALQMARDATYAAATHECKPLASEYAFSVRFFAW